MEKAKCLDKFIDFSNIFKAFIGSNYLSMPFALSQSGIVFGLLLLVTIGWLSDYCCTKIVRCKEIIIKELMTRMETKHKSGLLPDDVEELLESGRLETCWKNQMTFSHIAKYTYGKKAQWLVSICLLILQFGFCTGYFIFIGNTLQELLYPAVTTNGTDKKNTTVIFNDSFKIPLIYLVMFPLPIFVLFSLLRTIRRIGLVSAFALLMVAFGYFSIFGFILNEFSDNSDFALVKFKNLPMVFGLMTSNFEGIGTIIPIESSMVGNRHNFPKYLHISINLVIVILGSFGAVGYVHFGEKTAQIFSQNLEHSTFISVVNCGLILGAMSTYPLQMFPVIEIAEFLLFRKTSPDSNKVGFRNNDNFLSKIYVKQVDPCKQEKKKLNYEEITAHGEHNESKYGSFEADDSIHLSATIGDNNCKEMLTKKEERMIKIIEGTKIEASTWKRNLLRALLVLLQMGLAVAMRYNFAYLISFVGSLGGSFLVYILPAAIHYKLTNENGSSYFVRCGDICIIIFGIIGSIISIIGTIATMAQ